LFNQELFLIHAMKIIWSWHRWWKAASRTFHFH